MYTIVGANGYLGSYIRKVILEDTNDYIKSVEMHVPETERDSSYIWII